MKRAKHSGEHPAGCPACITKAEQLKMPWHKIAHLSYQDVMAERYDEFKKLHSKAMKKNPVRIVKGGTKRKKCPVCGKLFAPGETAHVHGNPKGKRNPIAIYNPPRGEPLPMAVTEIRYRRTDGEYRGEFFKHHFKARPTVVGLPDGSLLIKAKGKRLWGTV